MSMIELSWEGPIASISLNRPERRNALPIAGWENLDAVVQNVGEARVVILRSSVSNVFSAGADIGEFVELQVDLSLRERFRCTMRRAIDAVASLPMPVIAAVDGGCFGAAVALALASDIRIGGDHAVFAVTPARLGIGYPKEDVARLSAQIGRGPAASMLFTAESLSADEAAAIGLIERRAAHAGDAATALAATIANSAPAAVRLLKRTLAGENTDQPFDDAFGSLELAEGLDAFRSRRTPRFA